MRNVCFVQESGDMIRFKHSKTKSFSKSKLVRAYEKCLHHRVFTNLLQCLITCIKT